MADAPLLVHDEEEDVTKVLSTRPAREGTVASSILSLVISACGAGVLSLPFALSCTGWAAGSCTLLVFAVASAWSLELIEMRARDLGTASFEATGAALWGPRAGLLIELLLFATLAVAQVTFAVLVGDLLPPLCAQLSAPSAPPAICATRRNAIGGALALASVPSLFTRLHALRHVSLGALACLAFLLAVVCAELARRAARGELARAGRPLRPPADWTAWLGAFPIQTAAFSNQFNYTAMMAELQRPTPERLRVVRLTSVGACFAVCCAYGLVGYAIFGEGVTGDLLEAFGAARGSLGGALRAGRAALAACLILKVPLLLQPMRSIAIGWASRACGDGGCAYVHGCTTAALLCGIYCASTLLERVEDVFAIAGALGLMLVCFVVPGSFAFRPPFSSARRASTRLRVQGAALIAFGSVLTATSVFACISNLARVQ
ncbi:hypothetical protein KFE25_011147 [Diacronema lutheri]|uniref:Amino acid transporter transmembrane domain-containing protein n=1 Tax=Diacronema lutheri TaxID=2081491 RepID=A0A8J5XPM4_DIALT|nr:hypothetical protein KFE25_011147 [Diacronema lutheri]